MRQNIDKYSILYKVSIHSHGHTEFGIDSELILDTFKFLVGKVACAFFIVNLLIFLFDFIFFDIRTCF